MPTQGMVPYKKMRGIQAQKGGEERKRKKEKEKDCILEIPFNSRFRLIT
jgi:hypothetical protein